jgi:uncharacterized membrane protein
VPRSDVIVLGMSVEEGIKFVISGGIVAPPTRVAAKPIAVDPRSQTAVTSPS